MSSSWRRRTRKSTGAALVQNKLNQMDSLYVPGRSGGVFYYCPSIFPRCFLPPVFLITSQSLKAMSPIPTANQLNVNRGWRLLVNHHDSGRFHFLHIRSFQLTLFHSKSFGILKLWAFLSQTPSSRMDIDISAWDDTISIGLEKSR